MGIGFVAVPVVTRPRLPQLGRNLLRHHQGRRADFTEAEVCIQDEDQPDGRVDCCAREDVARWAVNLEALNVSKSTVGT